jgi:hypothetical protein
MDWRAVQAAFPRLLDWRRPRVDARASEPGDVPAPVAPTPDPRIAVSSAISSDCRGPRRAGAGTCYTHVVRNGELLTSISKSYGTSLAVLMMDNALTSSAIITAGTALSVCQPPTGARARGPV